MKRSLLALLAGLALAACVFKPGGTCDTAADCFAGQSCTSGICVGCRVDADCQGWQTCDGLRRCVTVAGRCASDQGCEAWQTCDATHTCALEPGACDASGGCQAWQVCDAHACTLPAGRCDTAADCGAAQVCTAEHRCASGCPTGSECQAWEACGADQTCALQPGRCLATIDCSSWQTCDVSSHACQLSPGKCDAGVGCQAWEACTVHDCTLLAGRCDAAGDCAAWQTCDATHACALAPGRCQTGAECQAWETCNASNTCVLQAGRCAGDGDCSVGLFCSAGHTCESLRVSPGAVYYAGELAGTQSVGLASPEAPAAPWYGFPPQLSGPALVRIHPDGGIVYRYLVQSADSCTSTFLRGVQDQLAWFSFYWDYPIPRRNNDIQLLEVPVCAGFLLQGGTGAILYSVAGAGDGRVHWFDAGGIERAAHGEVLAWHANGTMLFKPDQPTDAPLQLLGPAGAVTVVTGLTLRSSNVPIHARTAGDGFWVLHSPTGPSWPMERWSVGLDGAATRMSTYAAPPFLTPFFDPGDVAMDAAGVVWVNVVDFELGRVEPDPGGASIVVTNVLPAGRGIVTAPVYLPYLLPGGALTTGP